MTSVEGGVFLTVGQDQLAGTDDPDGAGRGWHKSAIRKELKRHNAVEPVIGHMKADGRLARNFLKGTQG